MTGRSTSPENICAVVVTYFPGAACAAHLPSLAQQVGSIVVVDNGSSAETLAPIEAAAASIGATLIRLGDNLGIAAALNAGLNHARHHGFTWLATFDQDSQVTPGMIPEMIRVYDTYPSAASIGLIAPVHFDRNAGQVIGDSRADARGPGWRVVASAMTSGNLVHVDKAGAVGGFDASLFIDYVDHEFCLRLRRHGFQVLEATRARLLHSLGRMEKRRLGPWQVHVSHHAPVRRYYMSRNRVIVWRQYWKSEPRWIARDMRKLLSELASLVLFEPDISSKVRMILRGLRDGLRNTRGPYSGPS